MTSTPSTTTLPIKHIFTRPGYEGPIPAYSGRRGSYDTSLLVSPKGSKPVLRLSSDLVVKFGSNVKVNEAEGLLLVEREAPDVPAPRVHACYVVGPWEDRYEALGESKYDTYIIMTLIEGEELEQAWSTLGAAEKNAIAVQMTGYMQTLRAIPAPTINLICSAEKGPLCDSMFTYQDTKGPFDNLESFHDALVAMQHKSTPRQHLNPMVQGALARIPQGPSVFTHADLQARNIMVSKGKVTGIIDWEMCGWYPEYWEYARCFRVETFPKDWPDLVRQMLQPHDVEWALLRMINHHIW